MSNLVRRKYYQKSPSILVHNNGNCYGRSVTIDKDKIQLDENDERSIPSGAVIVKDVNDIHRFLPRTKATEKVTTSDQVLNVTNPFAFAPNDVLYLTLPYALVTVSGYTDDETVSVTVNGVTVSVTSEDGDNDNIKFATKLANAINENRPANKLVTAVSEGAEVYILGNSVVDFHNISVVKDTSLSVVLSDIADDGSFNTIADDTLSTLKTNTKAIGTVSSVDRKNSEITLQSNSAVEFIKDVPFGVKCKELIGLVVLDYNMTEMNNFDFAPLTESNGVYAKRIPYLDADVEDELHCITFMYK